MKNVILYGALVLAFGSISAVCAYNDMATVAAIWAYSCGIWTALTMQSWHLRHD